MTDYSIEELLPHRSPMIFISAVDSVDLDGGHLVARFEVKESDIAYQHELNGIPTYASLEYMAQAIGCFVGIYDRTHHPDKEPGVGFVLGTRKLSVKNPVFHVGQTYFVDIKLLFFEESIASFECIIYNADKQEISQAIVNAYRPDNIETFRKEYT